MKNHNKTSNTVSRRTFLTGTTALASSALFHIPTIVPSSVFGATAPSNTLRLGCIGTGRMGKGNMMEALHTGLDDKYILMVVVLMDRNAVGNEILHQNRTKFLSFHRADLGFREY